MPNHSPRVIRLVCSVPGRLRLRLPWLPTNPDDAEPIADHLAGLEGMQEVKVRPFTGSVLCLYDRERLREDRILAEVRRHTQVAIVLRPGEQHPEVRAAGRGRAVATGSRIREAVLEGFRDMNEQIVESTEGRLDLGALTGLGLLGVGALEILTSRHVPAPPWFNLAWWSYRTFTISGEAEEGEAEAEAELGPI